jgi:CHAD domain-containing protein
MVEGIEGRADAAPNPLVESFERRVAEFTAAARRVRTGSDPEAIHDLRVATRRLVAVLRVWKELVPARARRDAERALRRLRRRIGRARELEVHIALLEERFAARAVTACPPAAEVLERLRERLTRRRRSAARRVSPRRLRRVLRRVEAAGAGLDAPRPGTSPRALTVEHRMAGQAASALKSASEHPDDVSLHEARVTVKKWRYTLECLGETMPGATPQPVRPLRRIQRELGEAHDRALLLGLLERYTRRAEPADGGDEFQGVVGKLDLERGRAVRRFQRLAAALIDRSRDTASVPPERGRIAARAAAVESSVPAAPLEPAAPAGTPAGTSEDGDGAPRVGPQPPDERKDPRDERWDRMATWLERTPRPR